MTSQRYATIILFLLFMSSTALTQSLKPILFKGATLIDGWNNVALTNTNVVIRGKSISLAGKAYSNIPPDGASVIDVSGKYIIPGLIDVHAQYRTVEDLKMMFLMGVTTANIIVSSPEQRREVERLQRDDSANIPELMVMYTMPMAQSSVEEDDRSAIDSLLRKLPRTEAEARAHIANMKENGINHVLLKYDDLQWCGDSQHHEEQVDTMALTVFMKEAKRQRLLVSIQTPKLRNAEVMLEVGAFSIVHGILDERLSSAVVSRMGSNNVYYVPTLTFFEYLANGPSIVQRLLGDSLFRRALPQATMMEYAAPQFRSGFYSTCTNNAYASDHLEIIYDNASAVIKDYIPVPVGSNLPTLPGIAYHIELENLVKAGLTPMQAILSASVFSSEYLGLRDKVGFVHLKFEADFLVLDKNPLEDIRNTTSISMIVKNGVLYDVQSLRENYRK
ncbi:MAG: hypothetical protein EPO24_11925 [Bacteroidetes bacterium]|nr:MAG: hypothetical protein EPO24_11925 [Bacteroidota bacterium]